MLDMGVQLKALLTALFQTVSYLGASTAFEDEEGTEESWAHERCLFCFFACLLV